MDCPSSRARESADYIRSRTNHRPRIGVILGTGLSGVSSLLKSEKWDVVEYDDVPNFPVSTAPGHKSELTFVSMKGVDVVFMRGRFHLYEGYDIHTCALPVLVLHHLGITRLLVTNASGSLNPDFSPGDLMVIEDHINLQGLVGISPLRSTHSISNPFFPMNDAYDPDLVSAAMLEAEKLGLSPRKGVYTMVAGPNFETAAEVRMLRLLGADVVGMSSVHEVLMARNCGMKVLGLSLITNVAIDTKNAHQEHQVHPDHVVHLASSKEMHMAKLLERLIVIMANDEDSS